VKLRPGEELELQSADGVIFGKLEAFGESGDSMQGRFPVDCFSYSLKLVKVKK